MLYEYTGRYTKYAYYVNVCVISSMKHSSDNLLADDNTWSAILEPALCQDPAAVECLARLLLTIKKAIESGAEGVIQASQTLSHGIEFIYPYTNAHKAALELYVLSLEGELNPETNRST
jgi:hypothetical protein